jgi:hypothetical protein
LFEEGAQYECVVLRRTAREAGMSDREVFQLSVTYAAVAAVVLFFLLTVVVAFLSELLAHRKMRHAFHSHRPYGPR